VSTTAATVPGDASHVADEIVARLERLPFSRFHLHLASILGVGTFFDAFDSLTIASALPVIFGTLHIGFVNAGLVVSAGFFGALVGAIIIGFLSELYGRKFAFLFSLLLFGLATAAVPFSWNLRSMLVLRVLQGLGIGGEVPIAAAMLNEFVRGRNRGRVGGLYQSLFAWGTILTPTLSLLFFAAFGLQLGWKVLFWFGGVPVLAAVYGLFRLPESPRWLADKGRTTEANQVVASIEAHYDPTDLEAPEVHFQADVKPTRFGELFAGGYWRRTVLIWTQFFTYSVVSNTLGGWLPTVYTRVGHVSTQFALVLTIIGGIVGVTVGAYGFAFFSDRIGRKPLFVLGFALIILGGLAGILMVSLLHAASWPILFSAGVIMLLGTGFNSNGVYLYTAELFPTRMRAWATSTGHGASRLAGVIGPILLGILLASKFGIGGLYAMFLIAAIIGLMVMLALGIETKQQVLEEISA